MYFVFRNVFLSLLNRWNPVTWVESTQCKVIMANVRHYAGGAYLKAVTNKGHEREARITVEFTGNTYEQTTGILKIWTHE